MGSGNKGIQHWYHDMGVSSHSNKSFKNLNWRSLSYSLVTDNSIGLSAANIITLSITSGGSVSLSSHTTACFMIGAL